ncbi:MAG: 23S rRNA pseudouridine(955/2504/2580) synthase, partial [Moraxellaceae bacterium]|nr:23S rRNA pseudouridine(955/2504/2580) synthase [Moraxellaceae bacterium]
MSSDEEVSASVRFLTVPDDVAGQRIDNFLITQLKGAPRTLVYRILRTGEVRVNKGRAKPDYRLEAG